MMSYLGLDKIKLLIGIGALVRSLWATQIWRGEICLKKLQKLAVCDAQLCVAHTIYSFLEM